MARSNRNNHPGANVETPEVEASVETPEVEGVETPEVEGTEGTSVETPEVEGAGSEVAKVEDEAGDAGQGDEGAAEPEDELAALSLPELSAMMREALNKADMELVQRLFPLIEAKGKDQAAPAPAAAKDRTHTQVKREVSQAIVDTLSANFDKLVAGPAEEPYNDEERKVAAAKIANICGYLPYAANLVWPENFPARTGRGMGRQVTASNAGDSDSE
jgi:hypothetical protein